MTNAAKYPETTEKILGCANRVHSALGSGYQDEVYRRCMAVEIDQSELEFKKDVETPIFFRGMEVGKRHADFVVEDGVVVAIRAVPELTEMHYSQIINQVDAHKAAVGLLINFGEKTLNFKRFVKSTKGA
jgi:GxxExxY protein